MPALINMQFHLIARIDDATQMVLEHVGVHDNFENALKTRLNWSKPIAIYRPKTILEWPSSIYSQEAKLLYPKI